MARKYKLVNKNSLYKNKLLISKEVFDILPDEHKEFYQEVESLSELRQLQREQNDLDLRSELGHLKTLPPDKPSKSFKKNVDKSPKLTSGNYTYYTVDSSNNDVEYIEIPKF